MPDPLSFSSANIPASSFPTNPNTLIGCPTPVSTRSELIDPPSVRCGSSKTRFLNRCCSLCGHIDCCIDNRKDQAVRCRRYGFLDWCFYFAVSGIIPIKCCAKHRGPDKTVSPQIGVVNFPHFGPCLSALIRQGHLRAFY